jgi:ABC-type amino acid transport substrate-binding protein
VWISGLVAGLACLAPAAALGESCPEDPGPDRLVIGVRKDAPPFSAAPDYAPVGQSEDTYWGYTVDLCRDFAEARAPDWCFAEVTPETRWAKLAGEEIDMLCGATTVTLHVVRNFVPSLYTFVTATTLMAGPVPPQDGAPPAIGFRAGTTARPETSYSNTGADGTNSVPSVIAGAFPDAQEIDWIDVAEHREALTKLQTGEIGAYIADRPILSALRRLAAPDLRNSLRISPGSVRLQPYAVMFPDTAEGRARAFDFNRFLIETRFSRTAFDGFRRDLRNRFGSDVDVSFLTLAALQGEIPEGEAVPVQDD